MLSCLLQMELLNEGLKDVLRGYLKQRNGYTNSGLSLLKKNKMKNFP